MYLINLSNYLLKNILKSFTPKRKTLISFCNTVTKGSQVISMFRGWLTLDDKYTSRFGSVVRTRNIHINK